MYPSYSRANRRLYGPPDSVKGNDPTKSKFQTYLTNCKSFYSCIHCLTQLANHDELVSRSFQGTFGRAYLFNKVVNTSCGVAVERDLNTGPHAVADLYCANCKRTLGWKYERAYIESQKYKEGKYIIELAHVVRQNRHLEMDKSEMFKLGMSGNGNSSASNRFRDSMSPPSLSEVSSPSSSSNGDVDDEFMFPFYDEMFPSSSCPNDLTHHHHNRTRRSLYLDSTPYDWKYSTESSPTSSATTDKERQDNSTSSLASSSKLSPYSAASYSRSTPRSTSHSPSGRRLTMVKRTSYQGEHVRSYVYHEVIDDSGDEEPLSADEETQFKFESDASKPFVFRQYRIGCNNNNQCDLPKLYRSTYPLGYSELILNTSDGDSTAKASTSASSSSSSSSSSNNDTAQQSRDEETSSCTLVGIDDTVCPTNEQVDPVRDNSFSLDDEQFYDCYTDTSNGSNSNNNTNNNNNNHNNDVVSH